LFLFHDREVELEVRLLYSQKGDSLVKNVLLLALLALVVTPGSAYGKNCKQSGDHQGNNKGCKDGISATEKFGIGMGGAALISVAGYLLLRRRRAAKFFDGVPLN